MKLQQIKEIPHKKRKVYVEGAAQRLTTNQRKQLRNFRIRFACQTDRLLPVPVRFIDLRKGKVSARLTEV